MTPKPIAPIKPTNYRRAPEREVMEKVKLSTIYIDGSHEYSYEEFINLFKNANIDRFKFPESKLYIMMNNTSEYEEADFTIYAYKKVPNQSYDAQYGIYLNYLKVFEESFKEYEEKFALYEIELQKYNEELPMQEAQNRARAIQYHEEQLRKLKSYQNI